jgi:pimeloyl-[acyl-carrier protein] methyl ester esterase
LKKKASFLWLSGWSVPANVWDIQTSYWPHIFHKKVDFYRCKTEHDIISSTLEAFKQLPTPIYVIGWSLGAMVALELAHICSKQIQILFLIGGTPKFIRNPLLSPYGWNRRVLQKMKEKLYYDKKAVISSFHQQMFSSMEKNQGVYTAWKNEMREQLPTTENLIAGLNYIYSFQAYDYLPSLQIPVFLLTGNEDIICPPEASQQLSKAIPQGYLTIWEKVGHIPFWTNSNQFYQWMKESIPFE